jgi:hypothetical protein
VRDVFETDLAGDLRHSLRAEAAVAWGHVDRGRVLDLAARRRVDSSARRRRLIVLLAAALVVVPIGALAMSGAFRTDRDAVVVPPRPTSSPEAIASPNAPVAPSRGSFVRTGDLGAGREGHAAVLLDDGRVLVIGGTQNGAAPPAELYDPRTGHFERVALSRDGIEGGLDVDGAGFSVTTLADGRVLVAGGRIDPPDIGVPPLRVSVHPYPVAAALLFDPATGTTTVTGSMTVARADHVAARLPDGRVPIAGGRDQDADGFDRSLRTAELYDPTTETFTPTGSMASDRYSDVDIVMTATVLPSGRVLVRGGGRFEGEWPNGMSIPPVGVDEIFDPISGAFGTIPSVGSPESGSVVLLEDERIRRYDLSSGEAIDITPDPPELVRRFGERCRKLPWDCWNGYTSTPLSDGTILRTGGTIAVIEPAGSAREWRWDEQTVGEILDPSSRATASTAPLTEPRTGHTATLLPDGRVLLIGGRVPNAESYPRYVTAAELYVPD